MNLFSKLSVYIVLGLALIAPTSFAFAQIAANSNVENEIAGQLNAATKEAGYDRPMDPRLIAVSLIRIVLSLLGTIFVVMIIYAGWLWMTSGGSAEQADTAKGLIYNAVIGIIIVFAAYSITSFVFNSLVRTRVPTFDPNLVPRPQDARSYQFTTQ